jgi:hypothetical protein
MVWASHVWCERCPRPDPCRPQTTTAELFFDLVYVFAITQLSVQELLSALVNEVPAPTSVERFAFLVDHLLPRALAPVEPTAFALACAQVLWGAGPALGARAVVFECGGTTCVLRRGAPEDATKLAAWRPVRGESVAHSHP